ncbi:glycine-rich cell wall structural protein-like [Trichoplusia ni]|uniref:Glycine-rich cell wall structural protein-like n=1 Tax=Trichoplusia ni TaxID=7111 RepID=A0A7E5WA60_TRINI|nr:glycine-rich cell wall structural protein-like [Trichoplusia ni]
MKTFILLITVCAAFAMAKGASLERVLAPVQSAAPADLETAEDHYHGYGGHHFHGYGGYGHGGYGLGGYGHGYGHGYGNYGHGGYGYGGHGYGIGPGLGGIYFGFGR